MKLLHVVGELLHILELDLILTHETNMFLTSQCD
jgi:hypothetical protein